MSRINLKKNSSLEKISYASLYKNSTNFKNKQLLGKKLTKQNLEKTKQVQLIPQLIIF